MEKDFSSYYQQQEFKNILTRYAENKQGYFDAEELEDLADYFISQHKISKALEIINHSIHLHPQYIQMIKLKFRILVLLDDKEGAQDLLCLLPDTECTQEKFTLELLFLLDKENVSDAIRICDQFLSEQKDPVEKAIEISSLFTNHGFADAASLCLKKMILRHPDNLELKSALAEAYLFADKPQAAIPLINEVLDHVPYSIDEWNMLGEAYMALSDYNQALEAYSFAEIIDATHPEMMLKTGHCFFKLKNYIKAIDYYQRYLEQEDFFKEEACFFLGLSFYSLKKFDQAIPYLEKSIASNHKFFSHTYDAYSYLSICYAGKKEYGKAINYINLAITENPEEEEGYLKKSQLYLIADQINEAKSSFMEVMKISNNKRETLKAIENIFKRFDLPEEGEMILEALKKVYVAGLFPEPGNQYPSQV